MAPTTVQQLDDWMTATCCNHHSYAIGTRTIDEGFGLERRGASFVWYYTERGLRQDLTFFETEEEAVAHAYNAIRADTWARHHLVGFIKNKRDVEKVLAELKRRAVACWTDEIPNGAADARTRIFVTGCDIKKVLDLQRKWSGRRP